MEHIPVTRYSNDRRQSEGGLRNELRTIASTRPSADNRASEKPTEKTQTADIPDRCVPTARCPAGPTRHRPRARLVGLLGTPVSIYPRCNLSLTQTHLEVQRDALRGKESHLDEVLSGEPYGRGKSGMRVIAMPRHRGNASRSRCVHFERYDVTPPTGTLWDRDW
jgi:hypothetical protein